MQNRYLQTPASTTTNLIHLIYRACASSCIIRDSGKKVELYIPLGILDIFELIESRHTNDPNVLLKLIKNIAQRELQSDNAQVLTQEFSSLYKKLVKLNPGDYCLSNEKIGEFEKFYSDEPITTTHHEIQRLLLTADSQDENLIELAGLNGFISVAKWCIEKQKIEPVFFNKILNQSILGGHANFVELLLWQKRINTKDCDDLFVMSTNANQGNIIRILYLHNNVSYTYDALDKAILTGAEKGHNSIVRHGCELSSLKTKSYYELWKNAATLATTHGHLLVFNTIYHFHSSLFKTLEDIEFGISIAAKNGHTNLVFFFIDKACDLTTATDNIMMSKASNYINKNLTWAAFDKAIEHNKISAATTIFTRHAHGLFQFGLGLFDSRSSIKLNKDTANKIFTNYFELAVQDKRNYSL